MPLENESIIFNLSSPDDKDPVDLAEKDPPPSSSDSKGDSDTAHDSVGEKSLSSSKKDPDSVTSPILPLDENLQKLISPEEREKMEENLDLVICYLEDIGIVDMRGVESKENWTQCGMMQEQKKFKHKLIFNNRELK